MAPRLAIVVPCFNEGAVLHEAASQLLGALETLIGTGRAHVESFLLFVYDGSSDTTWASMEQLND